MASVSTVSTLSGLFKEVYGDKLENLIPESAKLVKLVKFESQEKELGNLYHQPVIVADSHGFTYEAPAAGAFSLNDAIVMTTQDAQVNGYQLLLRDAIDYEAAAKASGGKKAFAKATELIVKRMMESMNKRLEIELFYGGKPLGTSLSGSAKDTTNTYWVMNAASWASGIWCGSENAEVNCYDSGGTIVGATVNYFKIVAVDNDTRTLTLYNVNPTDSAALVTALGTAGCTLYWKGSKTKQMSGIDTIISNTGSLFNINASTYSLWKSNTLSVSGQLSMAKILQGVSKAVSRGLDEDVTCFVNPNAWSDLHADVAALRMFDSSYRGSEGEQGVEKIVYHGQNGKIEIVSHPIVKAGDCFIFPLKRVKRIGAQDVSFKFPGFGEDVFFPLASQAGYEMRLYTDQALFIEAPAKCVKISGFTNSI